MNRIAPCGRIAEAGMGDIYEMQDYAVTFVTEFRYDSPRARYLVRKIDPASLGGGAPYDVLSEMWTDYDGDETYGDFSVVGDDPPTISTRAYEPGLATAVGGNLSTTDYYHGDLIGANRAMTDSLGASLAAFTYTAFGERICNDGAGGAGPCDGELFERFAYAGSWGYQQHDFPNEIGDPRPWPVGDGPIAIQHVGWRTYDPTLGRFLQRDPIGIEGGANVYEYAYSIPSAYTDSHGLSPSIPKVQRHYDFGCGYTGRWDWMPRPGGKLGGHMHVYCKMGSYRVEIAKITQYGGYQKKHGGKCLPVKPGQIPVPVREKIRAAVKVLGRACGQLLDTVCSPVLLQCGVCGGTIGYGTPGTMCRCIV